MFLLLLLIYLHLHPLLNHHHLPNFRFPFFHHYLISYLRKLRLSQPLLVRLQILQFLYHRMTYHRFVNLILLLHFIRFLYLFNSINLVTIQFIIFLPLFTQRLLLSPNLIFQEHLKHSGQVYFHHLSYRLQVYLL